MLFWVSVYQYNFIPLYMVELEWTYNFYFLWQHIQMSSLPISIYAEKAATMTIAKFEAMWEHNLKLCEKLMSCSCFFVKICIWTTNVIKSILLVKILLLWNLYCIVIIVLKGTVQYNIYILILTIFVVRTDFIFFP